MGIQIKNINDKKISGYKKPNKINFYRKFNENMIKCLFVKEFDELFNDIKDMNIYNYAVENICQDEYSACVLIFTLLSI